MIIKVERCLWHLENIVHIILFQAQFQSIYVKLFPRRWKLEITKSLLETFNLRNNQEVLILLELPLCIH